ncbi:hypothetical protein FRB94_010419 [Tulasnella sp. JGI-2019a]|nr:hypothetical protein FRB94_010419 [Tulasnella sp. JGI-2019a]
MSVKIREWQADRMRIETLNSSHPGQSDPDFDVYHPTKHRNSLGAKCLFFFAGQSRGLGVKDGFYKPFNRFLPNHTIFRRVIGVEPIWLALARGAVGLVFLVGLFAYGTIQCVQLPLNENGNTLSVRPVQKSLGDITPPFTSLENVSVIFTVYPTTDVWDLDVMPVPPLVEANGTSRVAKSGVWNTNVVPVPPLVEALYANGASRPCVVNQTALSTWNWSCIRSRGLPDAYPDDSVWGTTSSHSWLDSIQTSIKVTMDWSFVLEAGYEPSTIVAVTGLDTVYESMWYPNLSPSILQFQHPSYLKLQKGLQFQANVEIFHIAKRRLVFIDVSGFTFRPQVLTYHSITSTTPLQSATLINSNLSSVTFCPSFGLQGQHWLEEYRESTVVKGLGSTGTVLSSKIHPTLCRSL